MIEEMLRLRHPWGHSNYEISPSCRLPAGCHTAITGGPLPSEPVAVGLRVDRRSPRRAGRQLTGARTRRVPRSISVASLRLFAIIGIPNCDAELRQFTLRSGHQHRALLLANDFESSVSNLVRRYAPRCLVEKAIAEQLQFFYLNQLSSAMVMKVEFDLALTVLALNLYRLFARDLPPGRQRGTA